jgi:site-specific recombinase XerD
LRTYGPALNRFRAWLEAEGLGDPDVKAIDAKLCRRYMYQMDNMGLRPRTRRGYFIPLRGLYSMLIEHGAAEINPFKEVKLPKKDAPDQRLVTDEECRALWEAAGRLRSPVEAAQSRAFFACMLFGALRRKELLDLKIGDVVVSEGVLRVRRGKGEKPRTLYLCPEAVEALNQWLRLRPAACHDYLWTIDRGRRLGEAGMKRLMETVMAVAGYAGNPRITCHALRHAAATRLLHHGADLESIRDFLGHTQLQTTAIYLHSEMSHLRNVAALVSFGALEPTAPAPVPESETRKRRRLPPRPR